MIRYLTAFLVFVPGLALADLTGAGDAAAYQKLLLIVENTRENLQEVRKTVNLTEQLSQMRQQDFVKEVTAAGSAVSDMFQEVNGIQSDLASWQNDPVGTNQIQSDIDNMEARMTRANNAEGLESAAGYASALRSLKQVKWLGKVQLENERMTASGLNKNDAAQVSASSGMMASKILLEQEKRAIAQENLNTEVYIDTLKGVNYGGMGLMESAE